MLQTKQRHIRFKRTFDKILRLSIAIQDTICFLANLHENDDCLVHMDSQGQVIKQIIFKEPVDTFQMLSLKQVAVLLTESNSILIWDLQNNIQRIIPFNFQFTETDQSQIFAFPETHLFCVQENGKYNNNTFKLSYFQHPIGENEDPIHTYDSSQVWNYQYIIKKANNHSMICWFKGRYNDFFEFKTYNPKGQEQSYKFSLSILADNPSKPQIVLSAIWQSDQTFLLVCYSSPVGPNGMISSESKNFNVKYDTRQKKQRITNIQFGKYQANVIDTYCMGKYSMFRTFNFDNSGKAIVTPIYYVNNQSQRTIAEQKWECSYLYKYEFPGFEGEMFLECIYENADVDQVRIVQKRIKNEQKISGK